MNELQVVLITTIVFVILPLLICGYFITFKQKRHWINGVDQSKLSDPEAFGVFVGHSISVTGLLLGLVTFLFYFQVIGVIVFVLLLCTFSFLPLPCLFYARQKYM
jgi:uncharacterized protein YacL